MIPETEAGGTINIYINCGNRTSGDYFRELKRT